STTRGLMQKALDFLFLSDNIVFLIAGIAVLALFAFEVIAALIGGSLHLIHADSDIAFGNDVGGVMDWLNPNEVPVIILMTIFLGVFAALGFSLQWIWLGLGLPLLSPLITAPVTAAGALLPVKAASTVIGRVLPRETTNAITVDSLFGYYGKITIGPVMERAQGQAKVRDDHGVTHYFQVVLDDSGIAEEGDNVVLLERVSDDSHVFVVRKV
ncbi:MAG TPA: OB-fold-containig protein, partial [Hymenobacter sp.]